VTAFILKAFRSQEDRVVLRHTVMNIICFGDSITHASEFAITNQWPALLQNKLDDWRPHTYNVYNKGIGGDTTALALDRFLEDVIPLLPGVLLVQFGINDSDHREWTHIPRVGIEEFKKNLTEFHRLCTKRNGRCVFIVNHPLGIGSVRQGNRRSLRTNYAPYNDAIRETASELGAPIIDLPLLITRRRIRLKDFLQEDGIHLMPHGNHLYADMVFKQLKESILSSVQEDIRHEPHTK